MYFQRLQFFTYLQLYARCNVDRTMKQQKKLKLAVLIDADNVPYSNIKGMLRRSSKVWNSYFQRIHGDWISQLYQAGKQSYSKMQLHPIQQYSYTVGKIQATQHS